MGQLLSQQLLAVGIQTDVHGAFNFLLQVFGEMLPVQRMVEYGVNVIKYVALRYGLGVMVSKLSQRPIGDVFRALISIIRVRVQAKTLAVPAANRLIR